MREEVWIEMLRVNCLDRDDWQGPWGLKGRGMRKTMFMENGAKHASRPLHPSDPLLPFGMSICSLLSLPLQQNCLFSSTFPLVPVLKTALHICVTLCISRAAPVLVK